jgi:dolichol-phosphate mannosyltransferase
MGLSIVIPVYNEEEVILESLRSIHKIATEIEMNFEIICVDDGSRDQTAQKITEAIKLYPGVRLIKLQKNFGHMAALTAGMSQALGNLVLTMDADLQDPPEYIPTMLDMINSIDSNNEKIDVVQALRVDRTSDSILKRTTARLYYNLIKKLTGVSIPPNSADFRIMTKKTVNIILSIPEKGKIFRLLIPYLGFNIAYLNIRRDPRLAGTTKYSLRKMISLAINSVISFSYKPLRAMTIMGLIFSLVCGVLSAFYFIAYVKGESIKGWTSLALLLLASNALIMMSIGLLGEYVGRVHSALQNRPEFITKSNNNPEN